MGAQSSRRQDQDDDEPTDDCPADSMVVQTEQHAFSNEVEVRGAQFSDRNMSKSPSTQDAGQIAKLEKKFFVESQRTQMQLDELGHMQALVDKLETMVSRQASVAESEHERIATLEQSLTQQQVGTEEKVAKLLLAVAGEKKRAEVAEQALRKHQVILKDLREQMAAGATSTCIASMGKLGDKADSETHLMARPAPRVNAEQCIAELEVQVQSLQQEINRLTAEASNQQNWATQLFVDEGFEDDTRGNETLVEATRQLQEERAKRMDTQNKLLQKDQKLRELQRCVQAMQDAPDPSSTTPRCDHDQVAAPDAQRLRFELAEKEAQLQDLQQQFADELSKRANLQSQAIEREKQLQEMQFAVEDSDLLRQQAAQDQLTQKIREVHKLQSLLTEELTLRQSVQYSVIEKERTICDLQEQLAHFQRLYGPLKTSCVRSTTCPSSVAAEGGGAATFQLGGSTSLREPEDEDSTYEVSRESSSVVQPSMRSPMVSTVLGSPRSNRRSLNHIDTMAFKYQSRLALPSRTISLPCSPILNFRECEVSSLRMPTNLETVTQSHLRAVTLPFLPSLSIQEGVDSSSSMPPKQEMW
eukprot:CAMPEP_0172782544 /NCGR_PEP_ID=MMETSP1074-20121228/203985_1 /TAXON_ID=2916 /ORGANISM="Ceratium fusus, Strain PA161109" /LENGTH=585 /DNA_ID=CAMNT_0013619527 /DNA_START=41 /DNA_END=1795 /DNA_ORIENTATION=+